MSVTRDLIEPSAPDIVIAEAVGSCTDVADSPTFYADGDGACCGGAGQPAEQAASGQAASGQAHG
jgi:hypothetical protein